MIALIKWFTSYNMGLVFIDLKLELGTMTSLSGNNKYHIEILSLS